MSSSALKSLEPLSMLLSGVVVGGVGVCGDVDEEPAIFGLLVLEVDGTTDTSVEGC